MSLCCHAIIGGIKMIGCLTLPQCHRYESRREAFKIMESMTLYSQYIFFTVKNKHLFTSNRAIHKYETRNNTDLHLPAVNITKFYKEPYILSSKVFNHLHIKILVNDMKYFKLSLERFFYHHSFYSTEKYFAYNEGKDT